MSVGWGLVGLGRMAGLVAPAIATAESAHLAAVCSRDAAKAAEFGQRNGSSRSTASYRDLLADPAVDAVYIATPNALHAEQTIEAAAAGKHVLVEKPMALTTVDAERMVEAAHAAGVQLGVGFHLRHHPVHRELRRQVAAGDVGEPVYAHAMWASDLGELPLGSWGVTPELSGAGSMMGRGVHIVDLLRWFVGREVVEVLAMADPPSDRRPVEYLTAASLRFEGDCTAQFVVSWRLPNSDDSIRLYATEGCLEGRSTLSMEPSGELVSRRDGGIEQRRFPLHDLYALEFEAFSRAVEEGGEFHASGEDGLLVVELTNAILESARTGQAITLRETEAHAAL